MKYKTIHGRRRAVLRYNPPTYEKLLADSFALTEKYVDKGNKENTAAVKLISDIAYDLSARKISEEEKHDILLGAWIYTRAKIQKNYDRNYVSYFWSATNSSLFNIANATLLLDNKNTLDHPDDPTSFNCLASFSNYLEKDSSGLLPNLKRQEIMAKIHEKTSEVKSTLSEKIKKISGKLSVEKLINEGFGPMIAEYKDACKDDFCSKDYLSTYPLYLVYGRNSKRIEDLTFLKALDDHLIATNASKEECYFMRMGGAIKVMAGIENEHTIMSPERGDLYKLLQRYTGLKSSSENTLFAQAHLASLHKTVCTAVISEEQSAFWSEHKVELAALKEAKKEILELQNELSQTENGVQISAHHRRRNNIVNKLIDTTASSISHAGVLFAVLEIASFNFAGLLTTASAPVAITMLTAMYAAQYLRAPVSSAITCAVTPWIKPVILAPIKSVLHNKEKSSLPHPDDAITLSKEDIKLLKSLSNCPDNICSKKEKKELAALFDSGKLKLTSTESNTPVSCRAP